MGTRPKTRASVKKKYRKLVAGAIIIGALGAGAWWFLHTPDPVVALQQRPHKMPTLLLAKPDIKPPTNKWFSSLAFKQPSDPVFAYPLAMQTTTTGFDVSYPHVIASANTIDAGFVRDIGLQFGQAAQSFISSYDDLSVRLEIRVNNDPVGSVRITQGSPYIFMQLKKGAHMTLDAEAITQDGQTLSLQRSGNAYEFYLGANTTYDESSHTVTAKDVADVALYVVPPDANMAELREAAKHPLTGTEVSYKIDKTAQTSFTLHTTDGAATLYALLPDQTAPHMAAFGHFATLLGTQTLAKGNGFGFSTALPDMATQLPVQNLNAAQKSQLSAMVKQDAATLKFTGSDTYTAGKELYRAAQLLQLAKQLGLQSEASTIQATLKTELSQWLDPNTGNERQNKFFYYDTTLKGIVGVNPSFGSEDFNDHHFHYGYFLYAAGILGQYDGTFVSRYEPEVTMLARDIADANRGDAHFPYLRMFDQYAGHSWASGFAPFGSGNNQESSSEAVNAWQGMYVWAKAAGDDQLQTEAQWLFARESHAALADYVNPDLSRPELAGYNHTIISLLWGGKADSATFFDAAPESKLAIQLIPMSPASTYLAADKTRILQNLAQLQRETGQAPSKFKDYVAMYKALADPKGALTDATRIGDADIDAANSRSYLYAWLFTR